MHSFPTLLFVSISTRTYTDLIRTELTKKSEFGDEISALEDIVSRYDVPVIITDTYWRPLVWSNITESGLFGRATFLPNHVDPRVIRQLEREIKAFRKHAEPRPLYGSDERTVIGYLVYGNSTVIDSLSLMPLFQALLIIAFGTFLYFSIWSLVRTERSNLWVGLAKETAHQLGTPISSLMGWIEYMRTFQDIEDDIPSEVLFGQIKGICDDMDKDITRLRKVTNRFSQIGSIPALQYGDVAAMLDELVTYFRTRLPLLGRTIEISTEFNDVPHVAFNRDLLEWVLENIFKNSVDAITCDKGRISIGLELIETDNIIRITHTDNGKGISWDEQRNIFSPGYTTKTRGWGLGLTLAKRIVEDYHKGRIYVAWSRRGEGTTFAIDIPLFNATAHLPSKGRK